MSPPEMQKHTMCDLNEMNMGFPHKNSSKRHVCQQVQGGALCHHASGAASPSRDDHSRQVHTVWADVHGGHRDIGVDCPAGIPWRRRPSVGDIRVVCRLAAGLHGGHDVHDRGETHGIGARRGIGAAHARAVAPVAGTEAAAGVAVPGVATTTVSPWPCGTALQRVRALHTGQATDANLARGGCGGHVWGIAFDD